MDTNSLESILDNTDLEIIDVKKYDVNAIPLKIEEKTKEELMENPYDK